jgi:hypothetical protein
MAMGLCRSCYRLPERITRPFMDSFMKVYEHYRLEAIKDRGAETEVLPSDIEARSNDPTFKFRRNTFKISGVKFSSISASGC